MTKRMLIDASHPEETRVVIVDGNQVEELDFESRHKRQIRGNVYLARVTRVEPSLQAAFIEYGGNRHGFLAFPEIHPDYYQIPYEDRMKLIEAEEAEAAEDEADADSDEDEKPKRRRSANSKSKTKIKASDEETLDEEGSDDESDSGSEDHDENVDPSDEDVADASDAEVAEEQTKTASKRRQRVSRRRYKIQEVVKRGQILLVQAVKEERGNKGAAMTTYLSLAGRYCVLMPNTPRGGGISRKIANGTDRKRLKSIMSEMSVPQGMGVIVRTAGAKRNRTEIKRDFDYLSRLWSDIRETTLNSSAPALIHEEGDLVKRSIRDLYNKDIAEVLVEGPEAYKSAKTFIKMLMPSHAKFVKQYKEDIPLFLRYSVERQIENSLDSVVQLKSGGYLVIHPTEALVSIDVNSGRSTKERNVERTALRTNLEAAEETARQMRLRDLAGLIVIDFIDMDENRNNRAVEKKMKDALTRDRARIQTSRISQFGLMEISRQRRRRSLLEGSTAPCPHCSGVGRKRTIESSALAAIRAVEEIGARQAAKRIRLKTSPDVALYLFNEKRNLLQHVEENSNVFTEIVGDEELIRPAYDIEIIEKRSGKTADPLDAIEKELRREQQESRKSKKVERDTSEDEDDQSEESESRNADKDDDDNKGQKRRSRRGRRGGRNRRKDNNKSGDTQKSDQDENEDASATKKSNEPDESGKKSDDRSQDKPSRRGRRRAPSREQKSSDVEAKDNAEVGDQKSETSKQSQLPDSKNASKGRRRKAPSRKSADNKAEPEMKASAENMAEEKPAEKAEAKKPVDESRRRKAPTRKTTAAKNPAAKKSAKAKTATPETRETKTEVKSTASRRRTAPTRASSIPEAKAPAKAKKAPAKKVPVKKAAAKKAPAKSTAAKPAARKKAPVKPKAASGKAKAEPKATPKAKPAPKAKATPKKPAAKTPSKPAAAKARTRKAPARAKAPEKPSEQPLAKPVEKPSIPAQTKPAETVQPVKPKPKKKGWLNRLMSPD